MATDRSGRKTMRFASITALLVCLTLTGWAQETPPAPFQSQSDYLFSIKDNSAIQVLYRGVSIAESTYMFWLADWKWANPKIEMNQTGTGMWSFRGDVKKLGITITGTVTNQPANVLTFAYTLDAAQTHSNVTGGCLHWSLDLANPVFAEPAGNTAMLPDGAGWRWPVPGGEISVALTGEGARTALEKGHQNSIRTWFFEDALRAGKHTYVVTVTLPEGGKLEPTDEELFGPADKASWMRDIMTVDAFPVDLRHLNHRPAGSKGKVIVKGENLFFEDGSPARFWGTNLAAYALFVDRDVAQVQARRIAKAGFNLVRIHHHDSGWWVDPNVIDMKRDDSQHMDAQSLDQLDYWIKCLEDEGIYIWLDLHVSRVFKNGDVSNPFGTIKGFEEVRNNHRAAKGFCYFNENLQKLMMDFNEKYLNRTNPYTGKAYKDDPAVVTVLISNENDLTHHYGNIMLHDKQNPVHNALFEAAADEFCQKTGLPRNETGKTWVPGPSKIFLNNQEHLFNDLMVNHLRGMGINAPLVTTSFWGNNRLFCLPALTDGDIIDSHSYGRQELLRMNPRFVPLFTSWTASAQIADMPLAASEWTIAYPTPDRGTAPLFFAAMACLQGWDSLAQYNYSQTLFDRPDRPSEWSAFLDPALIGVMPAAAVAYRQQHIRLAQKTYFLKLDKHNAYYESINPDTSITLRTLPEVSRLVVGLPDVEELDWDSETPAPVGAEIITDWKKDYVPAGQDFLESDTGELRRDWNQGVYTINTPKTQVAEGWIGGKPINLADTGFAIETRCAVAAITSLDDRPIAESADILITVVARSLPADEEGVLYASEPVVGAVKIKAKPGMSLVPLNGNGSRGPAVEPPYADGMYTVVLDNATRTHWFKLTAAAEPAAGAPGA